LAGLDYRQAAAIPGAGGVVLADDTEVYPMTGWLAVFALMILVALACYWLTGLRVK